MTGENNGQNTISGRQDGPSVAKSDKGTKRYSKRIILVFVIGVGALIAMITMQTRFNHAGESTHERERSYHTPQPSGFAELAAEMRRDRRPVQIVTPPESKSEPEAPQRIVTIEAPGRVLCLPSPRRYYSNKNDAQAANTLRMMKLQALTAKPIVEGFELERSEGTNTARQAGGPPSNAVKGNVPSVMDFSESSAMAAFTQQGRQGQPLDSNGQAGKIDFLRNGGAALTPQAYSPSVPVPQQFPYELKAGTIIPGIMLTGINSDLPGSVAAQVSENVWDTATGRYVLIPKGTRILGVYDSEVTYGQRRVLLVWNRLVFPNGTTLDIAGSPGVDQAGYSGLSGKVDEHWGAMIKSALLASVFVAGAEIVYDRDTQGTGNENKTPRDVAAESAAGAILDMGTRMMSKASDIQPTITIRPGKRMGIFVQRDIVFPFTYF